MRDLRSDGTSASPQPEGLGEYYVVQRFCGGNYFTYLDMPGHVLARWLHLVSAIDARERELQADAGRDAELRAGGATNVKRTYFPDAD